jgi:eukaryotic-like serine/threonine-protein kinase
LCLGKRALRKVRAVPCITVGKSLGLYRQCSGPRVVGWVDRVGGAEQLSNDLSQRFSKDTFVQSEYLPMIHVAAVLGGINAAKAAYKVVEALAVAAPYALGSRAQIFEFALYPAYLRGEAYLAADEGTSAAAEFQKILDHPGVVQNEPIGALAHSGLGRAYALETGVDLAPGVRPAHAALKGGAATAPLQPDTLTKARTAYQDFFALWKDADPDIPILKQAKAEYAKLK